MQQGCKQNRHGTLSVDLLRHSSGRSVGEPRRSGNAAVFALEFERSITYITLEIY